MATRKPRPTTTRPAQAAAAINGIEAMLLAAQAQGGDSLRPVASSSPTRKGRRKPA